MGLEEFLLLGSELSLLLSRKVKKRLVLSHLEVAVVRPNNAVSIIHGNWTDVCEGLDLEGAFLALGVGQDQVELLSSRLDRIPPGQSGSEVNISSHAEIGRIDNLVGAWVVENSLGVDTSLVGECAIASDIVVERNVDLNSLRNEILNVLQLLQPVLALDVVAVGDHHSGHQPTKRSDTVTLSDTENRGIYVSRTGFQGAVSVGDGAPGVVVEVCFDVASNDTPQDTDQFVDLAGRGTANSVGNTDTVDTNLVDSGVDGQEINQVRTERVLTGEANLNALGLDVIDDLNGSVLNESHIFAVGVLSEVGRSSNNNVTVYILSTK